MIPAVFHTFRGNGPCCRVKVKFGPQRAPDFAGSASREYQKFQGKPRGAMRVGFLNPADRFADFCIRQRFVMFLPPALLRQREHRYLPNRLAKSRFWMRRASRY